MNLFAMIARGAAHAPKPQLPAAVVRAAEASRAQWLNALLVDETRAWMDLGEAQREVLSGLVTLLTLAGFLLVHDTRDADSADLRVIRGGISTADGCGQAGNVIREADARALSAAVGRARSVIMAGTVPGIIHAAQEMRRVADLPT